VNAVWPVMTHDDPGIRPAGRPDRCFYCNAHIGEPHGAECVTVVRLVEIRITAEVGDKTFTSTWRVLEPCSFDADSINFMYNESTWCASNLLRDHVKPNVTWDQPGVWEVLQALYDSGESCLCSEISCEYVRDIDSTPRRRS